MLAERRHEIEATLPVCHQVGEVHSKADNMWASVSAKTKRKYNDAFAGQLTPNKLARIAEPSCVRGAARSSCEVAWL